MYTDASRLKNTTSWLCMTTGKILHKKTETLNFNVSGSSEADDGNRTRLASLGSWSSTDELHLHLHVMNYNALFSKLQAFSQSICQSTGSIP